MKIEIARTRFSMVICAALAILVLPLSNQAHSIQGGTPSNSSPNTVFIVGEGTSCSGALLSPVVVATAAHCVVNSQTGVLKKEIFVSPPGTLLQRNSDGKIIISSSWTSVVSTQITSTFSQTGDKVSDNDLSFIVLSKPFDLAIETVIPSEEESEKFISDKATVRVYGYGKTSFESSPNSPHMASMDIHMKHTNFKNSIWLRSQNSSSCSGDSGGPVIYTTPTKVFVIGVVSGGRPSDSGPNCASKNSVDNQYYWTTVTLLSRYANLAFAAAASALVEAEKRVETERKTAESNYQIALKNKEVSDTNLQFASKLIEDLKTLTSKYEEVVLENLALKESNEALSSITSQIRTISCKSGRKIREVTGINPFCPTGYKKIKI